MDDRWKKGDDIEGEDRIYSIKIIIFFVMRFNFFLNLYILNVCEEWWKDDKETKV